MLLIFFVIDRRTNSCRRPARHTRVKQYTLLSTGANVFIKFYSPLSHIKKFQHNVSFLFAPKLSITERLKYLLLQGVTIEDPMQQARVDVDEGNQPWFRVGKFYEVHRGFCALGFRFMGIVDNPRNCRYDGTNNNKLVIRRSFAFS